MKKEYGKKALSILLVAFITLAMFPMLTTPAMGATDAQIEASGAAAVAYLASVQNPDGSWGWGGHEVAKTGLVLLKFLARAGELLPPRDPFDNNSTSPTYYEYANNVIAGFDYLFGHAQVVSITPQTHGNPDTNGNGKGITFYGYVYYTGIALTAIAFSGHPDDRSAMIGSVGPLTYKQIAQDIADWLYFAQGDTGNARGGFNYDALNNAGYRTDNSNGGYAYLGLAFAEDPPFNCIVPDWVRDELNIYIDWIQNDVDGDTNDGGSGYDHPESWVNILKTGNLIFEMAFYGDSPSTPRVQAAVDYLERHWRDPNWEPGWGYSLPVANYQAKFLVEKGLTYMGIDLIDTDGDGFSDDDWFNQEPPASPAQDLASVIVAQQLPSGGWPQSYWDGFPDAMLSTAWAVLALEKFAPPPEFGKRLVPEEGGLGAVVHVSISVNVGQGQTATVVDTLPPEFTYIRGTFMVNGMSATPSVKKTPPPPPRSQVISYTLTTPGTYMIEFDVKVTEAYWEDREVCNVVVGTWYLEDLPGDVDGDGDVDDDDISIVEAAFFSYPGHPNWDPRADLNNDGWVDFEDLAIVYVYYGTTNVVDEQEAVACFIIHAFEELSKSISIDGEPPVYLYVDEYIPFWERDWYHYGDSPYLDAVDYPSNYIESSTDGAITAKYGFEDIDLGDRVISNVILEGYTQYPNGPYDNLDIDVYSVDPQPGFVWLGSLWGTEEWGWHNVRWLDESVSDRIPETLTEEGLNDLTVLIYNYDIDHTYWPTRLDCLRLKVEFDPLTIKAETETQWTVEMEVTNPFSYTMTDVVITDRFGAEIEVDEPFPVSITHGTVSYTTKGKSATVFLTWEIGDLLPGETARLILLVSTDLNPAGQQEYSEPGIYELNSGATLKFIDPEQDVQLSAVTDSIYVTVLPAEDPP